MLTLILVVALLILIVTVLIAAMRRYDANNYFDQDRQPFYAEPDALVSAGLLYSQTDREQRERHTYTVTPAGEAGLRAWLREPSNDPGFLEHHFSGLVAPFDRGRIVTRRFALHRSRLAEYERLELLLVNRPEWRYALAAARVGVRFERRCLDFWKSVESEGEREEPRQRTRAHPANERDEEASNAERAETAAAADRAEMPRDDASDDEGGDGEQPEASESRDASGDGEGKGKAPDESERQERDQPDREADEDAEASGTDRADETETPEADRSDDGSQNGQQAEPSDKRGDSESDEPKTPDESERQENNQPDREADDDAEASGTDRADDAEDADPAETSGESGAETKDAYGGALNKAADDETR